LSTELIAALPHGAWAVLAVILYLMLREERQERMAMAKLLLESSKDQIISTTANTSATTLVAHEVGKLGGKIDQLVVLRGGRRE
jgi:preprotein translocase subunit SecF